MLAALAEAVYTVNHAANKVEAGEVGRMERFQQRPTRAWALSNRVGFPKESATEGANEIKDFVVLSVI